MKIFFFQQIPAELKLPGFSGVVTDKIQSLSMFIKESNTNWSNKLLKVMIKKKITF